MCRVFHESSTFSSSHSSTLYHNPRVAAFGGMLIFCEIFYHYGKTCDEEWERTMLATETRFGVNQTRLVYTLNSVNPKCLRLR